MADTTLYPKATGVVSPTPGSVKASTNASSEVPVASSTGTSSTISTGLFTPRERAGFAFSGISDLISAGSTWLSGKFNASQIELNANLLDYNIRALENDIDDIIYISGIHASNVMVEGEQMKANQRAAQAESGFDVSETETYINQVDYTDVLMRDQLTEYAYETAMAVRGKKNQITATRAQQALDKVEAEYIRKTSKAAAISEGVLGAAKIAGAFIL